MDISLNNKVKEIIGFIKKNHTISHCNDEFSHIQGKYKIWMYGDYMIFKMSKYSKFIYLELVLKNTDTAYLGFNLLKYDTKEDKIIHFFDFKNKFFDRTVKYFEPIFIKKELDLKLNHTTNIKHKVNKI